jgi:hypothetical protein
LAVGSILITVFPGLKDTPAHKTHPDFFVRNLRKNNDKCILILVIYWENRIVMYEN